MDNYTGYLEIHPNDDEINTLFSDSVENTYGLLQNQYLVARDKDDNVLRIMRFDGEKMQKVPYKSIGSKFLGSIKPRNPEQQMAIDMLYNKDITIKVITGKFGAGKDVLMCAAAVDMIEHGRFDKIVYVRNNIEVENSKPIGHLPGSYNEKMMPFVMPLADHLGGTYGLEMMMNENKIEVVHLGFIRGRDIRKSIILCSESENLTKEHIQLLIGRVAEGSELWINGDFKQCDSDVFRNNNGLLRSIDKLKGHHLFGYVHLKKSERSETAAMADLLD